MNGVITRIKYDDQRARGEGHSPVIVGRKLKAGQGVLPVGLILARDAAGEAVPFENVAAEELGTGTGATKPTRSLERFAGSCMARISSRTCRRSSSVRRRSCPGRT